jgi:hypothetical protein
MDIPVQTYKLLGRQINYEELEAKNRRLARFF